MRLRFTTVRGWNDNEKFAQEVDAKLAEIQAAGGTIISPVHLDSYVADQVHNIHTHDIVRVTLVRTAFITYVEATTQVVNQDVADLKACMRYLSKIIREEWDDDREQGLEWAEAVAGLYEDHVDAITGLAKDLPLTGAPAGAGDDGTIDGLLNRIDVEDERGRTRPLADYTYAGPGALLPTAAPEWATGRYRIEKDALVSAYADTLDDLWERVDVEGDRGDAYVGLLDNCTYYDTASNDQEVAEDDIPRRS